MPSGTEEEKESKQRVMQAALKEASLVPLEMMKKCAEGIGLMRGFAEKGSRLAISDAGCGAVLLAAAMRAAWLNVCINTKEIKDEKFAAKVNEEARAILNKWVIEADAVYTQVESQLI
jgi:formiminotetrahydrofolate cyclodeaminase